MAFFIVTAWLKGKLRVGEIPLRELLVFWDSFVLEPFLLGGLIMVAVKKVVKEKVR